MYYYKANNHLQEYIYIYLYYYNIAVKKKYITLP